MSTLQQELQLFRETLDWVKTKDFQHNNSLVAYYERYYQIASTHTPLIDEKWNDEGGFRHGASSIRGATSEMLTALYCVAVQRWKIHQIADPAEQTWGSDIKITQGVKEDKISVKSTKPRSIFVDGDLDIRLTLYKEYFKPATWRIGLISLVHPETKQLWMFNYEALANKFCDINDQGLCKPKFDPYTHVFIKQFQKEYQNCIIYNDMGTL